MTHADWDIRMGTCNPYAGNISQHKQSVSPSDLHKDEFGHCLVGGWVKISEWRIRRTVRPNPG